MRYTYLLIIALIVLSCNNKQESTSSADSKAEYSENSSAEESENNQKTVSVETTANESLLQKNKADFLKNYKKYLKLELKGSLNSLGGLYNATLKLTNTSGYFINSVSVDVSAYKASGAFYDSQVIDFANIQPHEEQVMPLKDFSRGSTFEKDILSVYCRELDNLRISPIEPI